MQCRLITPDSPLWLDCLSATRHDFYHLAQYVRLSAYDEGGDPCAFVAERGCNRFFVPLIVRPIELAKEAGCNLFDATSPYGYPSPLAFTADGGEPDADFLVEALHSLASLLRERGIISAFLRLHPLLPLPTAPFQNNGCLIQHGQTVFVDLTLSLEILWQQTSATTRNLINVARRSNYVVDMDGSQDNINAFAELYAETMRRVSATDQYFFSKKYLTQLIDGLKDYFHLCLVRIDGKVGAGGIFSETCGIVQYHLSGTKEEYLKHHGTRFMLDFIRTWAKQRGNLAFHLGGGFGSAEDSLFKFKAGFSPFRCPFHTWRLITDPHAYSAMVTQWERLAARVADPLEGFFPAYRKPLIDTHLPSPTVPMSYDKPT
ncbi:MAG: GNAT family N-acetyltransferase [Pirellulaceae bacterium]